MSAAVDFDALASDFGPHVGLAQQAHAEKFDDLFLQLTQMKMERPSKLKTLTNQMPALPLAPSSGGSSPTTVT